MFRAKASMAVVSSKRASTVMVLRRLSATISAAWWRASSRMRTASALAWATTARARPSASSATSSENRWAWRSTSPTSASEARWASTWPIRRVTCSSWVERSAMASATRSTVWETMRMSSSSESP